MQDEAKETEAAMIERLQSELAKLDAANKILKEDNVKLEIKASDLFKRNIRLEGEREAYGDIIEKMISELRSK